MSSKQGEIRYLNPVAVETAKKNIAVSRNLVSSILIIKTLISY